MGDTSIGPNTKNKILQNPEQEITLILNTVLLFAQPVAVVPSSVTHVLELPVQSFNYLIVVIVVKSTCSFRGAFTTGVACQQGTFTLLDSWFRPLLGIAYAPIVPNMLCLFPTFPFEYLVLSRFCPWYPC